MLAILFVVVIVIIVVAHITCQALLGAGNTVVNKIPVLMEITT